MKGDFTRWTFRPEQHYHGVLKQQGRVDLDADWNEQGAITAHRIETETVDVIGACGAPAADPGFTLTPDPKGTTLIIGKGRAYVDGLLCENETDLDIGQQPGAPHFILPTQQGTYLALMRVWLRHITALDDPEIREVALGGPDTCTRAKIVWQVGLSSVQSSGAGKTTCGSTIPGWDALVAGSTGKLSARAQPDPAATDPCTIPATAGYRRLENQLYRVEIHAPGNAGQATFKWSRENGSVVTSIVSWVPGSTDKITVSSTGRDAATGFAAGQWVELTDDTHDLDFLRGTLVQLANVEGLTLTLNKSTATGSLDQAAFPLNPRLRRWESNTAKAEQPVTTGSWLNLESGVQVLFADGSYQTGDYWLIPARTLTAEVDWPLQNGVPVAEPPKGIRRHYCRLAIVNLGPNGWSVVQNCLPVFPRLTSLGQGTSINSMHVTAVNLVLGTAAAVELRNDSQVPAASLLKGGSIQVLLDTPVDPVSVQPPTCFLTAELPHLLPSSAGLGTLVGFQPMVLPCAAAALPAGLGISLTLTPEVVTFLSGQIGPAVSRVLMRLMLKGSMIWSAADPSIYLDGEAFGVARLRFIELRLPSGGGLRGSDFEMWFWLSSAVPAPVPA